MSIEIFPDLKEFLGQPWSAWTDYLGYESPPEYEEDEYDRINAREELSGVMHLNKSDMGIYGQYPGAEPFELAICDFCGDKFKLAALAEHIGMRHQYEKNPSIDGVMSSNTKLFQNQEKKTRSACVFNRKDSIDKNFVIPANKIKPKSEGKVMASENLPKVDVKVLSHSSIQVEKPEHQETLAHAPTITEDSTKTIQLKLEPKKPDKLVPHTPPQKLITSKLLKNDGLIPVNLPNHKLKKCIESENLLKKAVVKEEYCINVSPQENSKASDDISKMKLVVELSPLEYLPNSMKVQSGNIDTKKKMQSEKRSSTVKDKTYNPDRHCGVVGKENTKPCTRSLTCKSHSMSLRRAVPDRSKEFDILLAEHRAQKEKEIFKRKINGESIVKAKLNSGIKSRTSSSRIKSNQMVTSSSSELSKPKGKTSRNIKSEFPRLSLPVSIKNPNIFTQFQNSNEEKCKGIYTTVVTNGGFNPVKILGSSSILMKQLLTNDGSIIGAVTRSTHVGTFQIHSPPKALTPKSTKFKVGDLFRQWYPGFRRSGGLLYSNNHIQKLYGIRPIAPKPDTKSVNNLIDATKCVTSQVLMQSKPTQNALRLNHRHPQTLCFFKKQIPPTLGPKKKNGGATLIPKQAASLLMPVNLNGVC